MDSSKTQTSFGNAVVEESVNGQDPSKKRSPYIAISHSLEGVNNTHDSNSSPKSDTSNLLKCKYEFGNTSTNVNEAIPDDNNYCAKLKTCKDEKQRQNEEIVILESSSLSSETGSWESVFPSKIHAALNPQTDVKDNNFKIMPCFIDAATLVDDEVIEVDKTNINSQKNETMITSHPIACTDKLHRSSENENDDSLEQDDISEDLDSRKDLSSIIFEMTPVTEDSLSTFENMVAARDKKTTETVKPELQSGSVLEDSYPNNEEPMLSEKYFISSTPPTTMLHIKSHSSCVSGADVEENLFPSSYQCSASIQSSNLIQHKSCDENINHEKTPHVKRENENIASNSKCIYSEDSKIYNANIQSILNHGNKILSSKSTIPSRNTETDQVIWEINYEQTKSEDAEEMAYRRQKKYSESSPVLSGGVSVEDHLPLTASNISSPMARRKIENTPIISGAYVPDTSVLSIKSPKQSTSSAWVVDMSGCPSISEKLVIKSKPIDKSLKNVLSESKSSSDRDCSKSRSSVESESSEKSGHKYFIDLSNLPDPFPAKNDISQEKHSEKKNFFSMYIDFGEKSTVKEMPPRLMSLSVRKHSDSSNSRSLDTKKLSATRKTGEKRNKSKSSESVIIAVSHHKDVPYKVSSESATALVHTNNNIKNRGSNSEHFKLDPEPAAIFVDADFNNRDKNREPSLKRHTKSAVVSVKSSGENQDRDTKAEMYNYSSKSKHSGESTCLKLCSNIASYEKVQEKEIKNEEIFVKLSDLDKPAPKVQSRSVNENWRNEVHPNPITRSIPESTWTNQGTIMTKSTETTHSFHSENALSLNRLFPHLKEFSRSIPGSLCSKTLSPLRAKLSNSAESDEQNLSDLSDVSSVQSSYCRSTIENNREISEIERHMYLISNCLSKLGEDLLHMFLEEIAPDVVIEVAGRRVKAHKCILSSRCQFFAGILSGGWVESAGNVIVIPTFSYDEVHFALCHIYCGISSIPAFINIVELSSVADMFGLDGLKEAIMHNLREKFCHNFHKPCEVCIVGVLECLALTSTYSLDELYEKCLKWITKYFNIFWVTKAFATLSKELLEKCLQQQVLSLTEEAIIETICGCANILETLPDVRWAETVVRLCRRLMSEVAYFIGPILSRVLRTLVTSPPKLTYVGYENLNKCIISAIELTSPSETCRVYQYLSELVKEMELNPILDLDIELESETISRRRLLIRYVGKWRLQCEKLFVCSPSIIIMTDAYKDLPIELRKRLRELGCSMYESRPQSAWSLTLDSKNSQSSSSMNDNRTSPSRSTKIDTVRMTFTPYSIKPKMQLSHNIEKHSNDSCKTKSRLVSDPPKIRTTKAQEQRARYNMTRAVLDCSQELSKKTGLSGSQNKSKFENTKPRYLELEPRHLKRNKENERKIVPNKLQQKPSSSNSSRNKSPIQPTVLRNSRARNNNLVLEKMKKAGKMKKPYSQTISQDTLASTTRPTSSEPSTESQKGSFSENVNSTRYGTYTKKKHEYPKNNSYNMRERSERFCKVACVMDRFDIVKTKIPTYVHKGSQSSREFSIDREFPNQKLSVSTNGQKPRDRCLSATLMCATKSSSAKIVIRTSDFKNSNKKQISTKSSDNTKEMSKTDIPSLQRSGTFVREDRPFGENPPN